MPSDSKPLVRVVFVESTARPHTVSDTVSDNVLDLTERRFLVASTWDDGDKVYRTKDGAGTRDRSSAALYHREEAESIAHGLRGGLPEVVGHSVDVEAVRGVS